VYDEYLYPAFQAWEGIAGEPLANVLAALRGLDSEELDEFFGIGHTALHGLTPVEAMCGQMTRVNRWCELTETAPALLAKEHPKRLEQVLACAATYWDFLLQEMQFDVGAEGLEDRRREAQYQRFLKRFLAHARKVHKEIHGAPA